MALFVMHARDLAPAFTIRDGQIRVDPLDLALHMKILPRIAGGSNAVKGTVLQLLGWAHRGQPFNSEPEADELVTHWQQANRPTHLTASNYPQTAARLCLMWDRVLNEGFTSFWL